MISYTYEDFERELEKSGLAGQFSSADMALAKNNANAGMSLLNYKIDYNNATTDEQRMLANKGAEDIRLKYGSYSGGEDGSKYYYKEQSPGSFTYDVPAPVYEDKYGEDIEALIESLKNRGEFSYNPEKDPLYSNYKKQYTREEKRATEDVLGDVAALTGGLPSSYAVTAAGQTANQYAAGLADKVPELYDVAYNKYLNEYNADLTHLNMLRDMEENEYSRYLDSLAQHNADRNFDYGQYVDEIGFRQQQNQDAYDRQKAEEQTSYNRNQDTMQNEYEIAVVAQEMGDDALMREFVKKYGNGHVINDIPPSIVSEFDNAKTNEEKLILINQWIRNGELTATEAESLLIKANIPAELWS